MSCFQICFKHLIQGKTLSERRKPSLYIAHWGVYLNSIKVTNIKLPPDGEWKVLLGNVQKSTLKQILGSLTHSQ